MTAPAHPTPKRDHWKVYFLVISGWYCACHEPPNGLPITRAAPRDQNVLRMHLNTKIGTILSTRSGVGCMGGLGGILAAYRSVCLALSRTVLQNRNWSVNMHE